MSLLNTLHARDTITSTTRWLKSDTVPWATLYIWSNVFGVVGRRAAEAGILEPTYVCREYIV